MIDAANPTEFFRFEFAGLVGDFFQHECRLEQRDGGAVFRREIVDIFSRRDGAGARHIARHDNRLAGNELAQMLRDQTRGEIITTAFAKADDHIDRFALVKIFDGVRAHSARHGKQ